MKRCIICGNTGDENSAVCSVCGGPFEDTVDGRDNMSKTQDMAQITRQLEAMLEKVPTVVDEEEDQILTDESAEGLFDTDELSDTRSSVTEFSLNVPEKDTAEEAAEEPEEEPEEELPVQDLEAVLQLDEDLVPEQKTAVPQGTEARQPRRMKSEPQIYGQAQMGDMAAYGSAQGMMRRNMQGRPMNGAPQGRPMNGGPQGRPMNGGPQGQPMNGGTQGRPMNGVPQGRPMNAAPQGRPMNAAPQGRPMNAAPQGQPMNAAPQGQPMNGAPQGQQMNPAQARYVKAVKETSRKCMKSPLFFLIVLLNTVALAGSVAAIFMKELNYSQFARLITEAGLPIQLASYVDDFKNIMATLDHSAVGVNLAILIPDLVFCLGLWMVFFCALAAGNKMATIGFSLMKVVVILQMILCCTVVLGGLIVSVTFVVAAWASGTQAMIISSVIAMAVMIIAAMFVIMYFFCYFATIKTCRLSAGAGETFGNASGYVGLVHIVLALTSVVGLLSGIVNAEISNIAASAGRMGWMILFGLWIFGYRKKMKEFTE